ncbi:hypothetical protein PAG57_09430, partial [Klebsiella quasipneumoniae]|uniref:hypothetical protein n=1 Tax=Klebsiella quasipneumoniae TaxID=1463165 RepID=UPI00283ABF61
KRAYCLKTQPATGETYPKSDLFNKATLIFDSLAAIANQHMMNTVFGDMVSKGIFFIDAEFNTCWIIKIKIMHIRSCVPA